MLKAQLGKCKPLTIESIEDGKFIDDGSYFYVVYRTPREYRRLAKAVGLMLDIRVPSFESVPNFFGRSVCMY